jgi:hypothetical protein
MDWLACERCVVPQRRVRTFDAQVSTHEGLAHVDMFYLDLDIVLLAIGGLGAHEATAGPKER